ncbi:MAG: DNA methyltransferase [Gallionellales bacterium 35-53-114]|jgi:DNA adenine methylase|nr:MAG: DNA methyltransferase [Gallionellales bacterium 35-53-114]OYZ65122.1 MAG: DNA methyltransferase [Gallionellales bacterium 24-53-125]OZB08030.1 MAG: DNA methyltransferase [Gallionellales bacterium 39-52-133]HQS59932.1 DNA adenine methylase [Gallionellaceae bacterium]HQS76686.1 DNA adenine methylase [Gallionellaceae bacterium]
MTPTRPLLRYHGGKWRLADWLISHFPAHRVYVEPFGGAASVLLQKPRSYSEVYNDLDGEIVNVFRVMQCPEKRDRLMEMLRFTPYARAEFELAWQPTDDQVESARRVIIRAQMGFGSAGATKGSTGFRRDTARRYTTAMMDWVRYRDCMPPIIERMTGVQIENRPALDVIRTNDADGVLFYIDPPYMHDTRVMDGGTRYYRHEMTNDDHAVLLDQVSKLRGMVVLNGYHSRLYDTALTGWTKYSKQSRAAAARGTAIRTEVIWLNQACADALAQQPYQQGRLIA